MSVSVRHGDCLAILPTLAPNSIDAVVTDPPYHLTMAKRLAGSNAGDVERNFTKTIAGQGVNPYRAQARGFMGKAWDGGDIAFRPEVWMQVLRVLKPGGHMVAFGGTRTYHRLACAIEDAGFEIRDQIQWLYGSGFPKSHSVSIAIDKQSGVPPRSKSFNMKGRGTRAEEMDANGREFLAPYEGATDLARQWSGWGTALKPAHEPIVLARKPFIGTVAENVLAHGTGALNIDGCRIGLVESDNVVRVNNDCASWETYGSGPNNSKKSQQMGRWPANVIHDGSEEVLTGFPDTAGQLAAVGPEYGDMLSINTFGDYGPRDTFEPRGDSGSAARFFYTAKADSDDRCGSKHPTVKPVDLIAYLCRLITPPKGVILDCFAGSGSTGMACLREGFDCVLIEREAEYVADIERRIAYVSGSDCPLFAEVR